MPHKHKRKTKDRSENDFDLPPSTLASALPVGTLPKQNAVKKAPANHDDTPKAFLRLMKLQNGGRASGGLDEVDLRTSKKRKLNPQGDEPLSGAAKSEEPRMLPGETMSEFSARVNQAIPISGLGPKSKKKNSVEHFKTRTEKRIEKMHEAWRLEEARRKEAEEEARDEADTADIDNLNGVADTHSQTNKRHGKRNGKGRGATGDDRDPWAVLKSSRGQSGGLNDVAQAPPEFKRTPQQKFKVKDGAAVKVENVPTKAGSLRRREELGNTRQNIIESYRRLMEDGRAQR